MKAPESVYGTRMNRFGRHLIILAALLILFFESACDNASAVSSDRLSAAAVPNGDGACQILVTVGQSQFDMRLDVLASVEQGVTIAANGSQQSEAHRVELLPQDVRIVPFDCSLDPSQIGGSGEYVVRASAYYAGTEQFYAVTKTTLMVVQMADGTFRALSSPQGDPIFSRDYRMGQLGLGCDVSLENTAQPVGGMIYFKVESSYDGYAPQLILETMGGIKFLDGGTRSLGIQSISNQRVDVQFGPIMAGGSRIIYVPFTIDPNSLAGLYNIRQTVIDNGAAKVENATVSIRIVEENGSKWIVEEGNSSPVLLGPEVVQGAGSGGIGNDQALSVQIPPNISDQTEDEPMVFQTPVPPVTEIDPAVEQQLMSPEVPPPPKIDTTLKWRYRLTGYYGNRWQLWDSFVQLHSGMGWAEFKDWVVIYNPELIADKYVFYAHKAYWLPERPDS